jgi:hypothetical protein
MKKRLHLFMLAILVAVATAGYAYYMRSAAPAQASGVQTAAALNRAGAFAPHRALYDLKMLSAKPNGSINNVDGKMLFAWDDACDGWTIEQRLDLTYQYEGGGSTRNKTSLVTWEAKDASLFRFNVKRETDGKTTEVFRGQATLASSGGTAHYIDPTDRMMELGAATVFPSLHTLELLQHAKAGDHFFAREVFDGADSEGKNLISAFIGDPETVTNKDPLQSGRQWPIRMAFFAPDNNTGTPDYEMTMKLLENGVASELTIDYGDFVVGATINSIESLKAGC